MRSRGFTLIEMLISIAILGFVMIAVYQSFDQGFRSYRTVVDNRELYETARLVMDRFQDDLSSAILFPDSDQLVFLGEDEDSFEGWPSDSLVFGTVNHLRLDPRLPESDQAEVHYWVAEDRSTGERHLLRREDPYPDEDHERGGFTLLLAEDVRGLELRYYDGTEWHEQWDARHEGEVAASSRGLRDPEAHYALLPKAVQVELVLHDSSDREHRFRSITRLPLARDFDRIHETPGDST